MKYVIIAAVVAMVLLVIVAREATKIVERYAKATGTPWQRFLAAYHDSVTVFLARLTAIVGALASFSSSLLPYLDPGTTFGGAMRDLFTPDTAKFWLAGIAGLGVVFEIARRRPGSVDPILPPVASAVAPITPVVS